MVGTKARISSAATVTDDVTCVNAHFHDNLIRRSAGAILLQRAESRIRRITLMTSGNPVLREVRGHAVFTGVFTCTGGTDTTHTGSYFGSSREDVLKINVVCLMILMLAVSLCFRLVTNCKPDHVSQISVRLESNFGSNVNLLRQRT